MGIKFVNDTERLVETAKEYVRAHPVNGLVSVYAGSSVGRGEADSFSDLDLVYCLADHSVPSESRNILFKGQIIQLDLGSMPAIDEVCAGPWDYRFLTEAIVVYDPDGTLHALLTDANTFMKSEKGRQLAFNQAVDVVERRKEWLMTSMEKGEWITAGVAANAVWADALLLYVYFVRRTLSTGSLLTVVRELGMYDQYQPIYFGGQCLKPEKLLHALKEYRAYLRAAFGNSFAFDPIQDDLMSRKTQRAKRANDYETIAWQLQADAFWCYLTSVKEKGLSLEQHFHSLPDSVSVHLTTLGFRPFTFRQIQTLFKQADDFIALATKELKAE